MSLSIIGAATATRELALRAARDLSLCPAAIQAALLTRELTVGTYMYRKACNALANIYDQCGKTDDPIQNSVQARAYAAHCADKLLMALIHEAYGVFCAPRIIRWTPCARH